MKEGNNKKSVVKRTEEKLKTFTEADIRAVKIEVGDATVRMAEDVKKRTRKEIRLCVKDSLFVELMGMEGEPLGRKRMESGWAIKDKAKDEPGEKVSSSFHGFKKPEEVVLCDENGIPIKRIAFHYEYSDDGITPNPNSFRFKNLLKINTPAPSASKSHTQPPHDSCHPRDPKPQRSDL